MRKVKYSFDHDSVRSATHNIFNQINDIDGEVLKQLVKTNPSLRGMILGYINENIYRNFLLTIPEITNIFKPDDHDRENNKSDFIVTYKNKNIKIQVKSILTNSIKFDLEKNCLTASVTNDASDKRSIVLNDGAQISTTCYKRGEYDILAVSIYPFINEHKFVYKLNKDCRLSTKYNNVDLLCSTEQIDETLHGWHQNLPNLLEII